MPESAQELIFLTPGYHYIIAVLHFNLPAIAFNIPFNEVEIDNMGMMGTEENISRQQFFKIF